VTSTVFNTPNVSVFDKTKSSSTEGGDCSKT
jgi:hypothetical protein